MVPSSATSKIRSPIELAHLGAQQHQIAVGKNVNSVVGEEEVDFDAALRRRFVQPFAGHVPLTHRFARRRDFHDHTDGGERYDEIAVGKPAHVLGGGVEIHVQCDLAVLSDTDEPADAALLLFGDAARADIEYHHARLPLFSDAGFYVVRG